MRRFPRLLPRAIVRGYEQALPHVVSLFPAFFSACFGAVFRFFTVDLGDILLLFHLFPITSKLIENALGFLVLPSTARLVGSLAYAEAVRFVIQTPAL